MNKPTTYTKIGEVISIDDNPNNLEDTIVIEADFAGNDEAQTILLNANYWLKARMEKWLVEGTAIQITFESTIADTTEFTDKDDVIKKHTKTNKARVAKIRRASKRMFAAALAEDIATTGKYEDISNAQATIIASILS